jgi:hypothetical protein
MYRNLVSANTLFSVPGVDLDNNAKFAKYLIREKQRELLSVKKAIAKKSVDQTETAAFELGELCEKYLIKLREYEHYFAMTMIQQHLTENPTGIYVQGKKP